MEKFKEFVTKHKTVIIGGALVIVAFVIGAVVL